MTSTVRYTEEVISFLFSFSGSERITRKRKKYSVICRLKEFFCWCRNDYKNRVTVITRNIRKTNSRSPQCTLQDMFYVACNFCLNFIRYSITCPYQIIFQMASFFIYVKAYMLTARNLEYKAFFSFDLKWCVYVIYISILSNKLQVKILRHNLSPTYFEHTFSVSRVHCVTNSYYVSC